MNLSHSDTTNGLKRAIKGRMQMLANVHWLFINSRWDGVEVSGIVTQQLAPYLRSGAARAVSLAATHVDGQFAAQAIASFAQTID